MPFLKKPFAWTKRGVVPSESIRETGLVGGKSLPASFINEQWTATNEAIEELQAKAGEIKTVNGQLPNANGNIDVSIDTNLLATKDELAAHKLDNTLHLTNGYLKVTNGSTDFLLKMDDDGVYLEEV